MITLRQIVTLIWRYAARFLWADSVNRGWLTVFSGTAVRLLIGFVASILLTRAFGPADYGVYAILGAVISIGGGLFDFGLTETAVKHIAATTENASAQQQAQVFVWLRLGMTVGGIGLGIILTPLLAQWLGLVEEVPLLVLAFLSIGTTALNGVLTAILQAKGRFAQLAMVLVFNALLTLVVTVVLVVSGSLTIATALWMGVLVSLAGFGVAWAFLPQGWRVWGRSPLSWPGWGVWQQQGRIFLGYGRWLWLATTLSLLAGYLDIFLMQRWLPAATVGRYALALNLANKGAIANSSLRTVLLPAAAKLRTKAEVRRYWRRGLLRSGGIGIAIFVVMPVGMWLLPRLYGASFAPAVPLLGWLLLMVVMDTFILPSLLLVYAFDRPHLIALSSGVQVGTFILVGAWLIPNGGTGSVVLVRFVAKVMATVVLFPFLYREYGRLPEVAYYHSE